jgi:hypothetical protein
VAEIRIWAYCANLNNVNTIFRAKEQQNPCSSAHLIAKEISIMHLFIQNKYQCWDIHCIHPTFALYTVNVHVSKIKKCSTKDLILNNLKNF